MVECALSQEIQLQFGGRLTCTGCSRSVKSHSPQSQQDPAGIVSIALIFLWPILATLIVLITVYT